MSAFGVELMTVSIHTWVDTDKCQYTKKVKKKPTDNTNEYT